MQIAMARGQYTQSLTMIEWIRTSRLSIKNSVDGRCTPYTLHPTPYTLHPTPYTLHPTPYTLHPTPWWQAAIGIPGRLKELLSVTSDPSTKDDAEHTLAAIEGRIDF